jgi:anaphase-promoting complex subunit 3
MNTGDESYYVSKFGKDVAIAFALLGDLNKRLHLSREACQAYRLALKYNPFLWTTFDNVCHLDRNSSPSEVFKLAQLPDFLREDPHVAIATNVPIAKKPLPLLAESLKEERANFTPNFVPNSFMNPPVLGKAIVSSTPSLPCMMTPLHFDSEQTKSFSSSSVQQVLPQALQFSAANTPSSLKTKPDNVVDTEQDPTLQVCLLLLLLFIVVVY